MGLTRSRFYALEYSNTVQSLPSNLVLSAGNEWAKKSSALIFGNLNDISVEKLMVFFIHIISSLKQKCEITDAHNRHVSYSTTMKSVWETTQAHSCFLQLVQECHKGCKLTWNTRQTYSVQPKRAPRSLRAPERPDDG